MRKSKMFFAKRFLISAFAFVFIAGSFFSLGGCSSEEGSTEPTTATSALINEAPASSADLYCHEFTSYDGVFVENGKNENVKNIAAMLVENRSKVFLDRAMVVYKYGDKTATFIVSGLPAGKKCWVLEAKKMTLDGKSEFVFDDCTSAFKSDAILTTDKIEVQTKDNAITVKNTSMKTLKNICVYYKNTYGDGNYLGGITYMMAFDTLDPGESFTKESGHFSDASEIVRYSFQEE